MYVLEKIVQSVIFSLLCIQIVSGYFALKYIALQQSEIYQKKQKFEDNLAKDLNDDEINNEK